MPAPCRPLLAGLLATPAITRGAAAQTRLEALVESFAGFYAPEGWKDIAPYIVVLIMLWVKPNGLFSSSMRKKV